jgi:hypothetical protein
MVTTNKEAPINRPIRPGYMEQVLNDKTYVVPKVLGQQLGEGLSLARIEKPDLSEALDMSGGVRFFHFTAVHSIDFCISNLSSRPDSGSDSCMEQPAKPDPTRSLTQRPDPGLIVTSIMVD